MEYKIQEWYSLARFGKDDSFVYVGCGWEGDCVYNEFEFITLEDAKEYLEDMIESDGVVILRETRQIVC